jgi:hypothetical protein
MYLIYNLDQIHQSFYESKKYIFSYIKNQMYICYEHKIFNNTLWHISSFLQCLLDDSYKAWKGHQHWSELQMF